MERTHTEQVASPAAIFETKRQNCINSNIKFSQLLMSDSMMGMGLAGFHSFSFSFLILYSICNQLNSMRWLLNRNDIAFGIVSLLL